MVSFTATVLTTIVATSIAQNYPLSSSAQAESDVAKRSPLSTIGRLGVAAGGAGVFGLAALWGSHRANAEEPLSDEDPSAPQPLST